jgi:serine/threonine-protein kinase RsbW/stage II sporulation protein AB (anti-sigma F factor)
VSDDRVTLRRPAVPETVPVMRSTLQAFADRHAIPAAVRASVALAVTEACTNVVLHAYLDAPEPGDVEVQASVQDGELVLQVSDEGRGMKPRPDSPGLGMGLPLIAQMADHFEVLDRAERPGVCLRMHFELSRADGRPGGSGGAGGAGGGRARDGGVHRRGGGAPRRRPRR